MKMDKVKEVIPITDGIFSHMNYQFWDLESTQMDIMLMTKCGFRNIAPIVTYYQDEPNTLLSDSRLTELADCILRAYKPKWDKLANLHKLDYDVIHNYIDEFRETLEDNEATDVDSQLVKTDKNYQDSESSIDGKTTTSQSNTSENKLNSTLVDNYESEFARSTSENSKRVDDLSESYTDKEYQKNVRTDDLENKTNKTNSSTKGNIGGDYTEKTTRVLSNKNDQTVNNGIYGFNSATSVGDTDGTSKATGSEDETITKVITGTKTETDGGSSESITNNTGTQINVLDTDIANKKLNSGTQKYDDEIKVVEKTQNKDNQINTSTSNNTGEFSNETIQLSTSSNKSESGLASNQKTDEVINRVLNRARMYTHKGNTGNLTSQQMLREEIELWRWNFIDEVLEDVKKYITIPIYY